MGCCCCFAWILLVALFAYLLKKLYAVFFDIPEVPFIDDKFWWGPGEAAAVEDVSIKPFKISVSDKELDDLKNRLINARPFTPPLKDVQHQYGTNTNLLKEIHTYWQTHYDWRKREVFLNQFPQYTTNIQGLNIHFLHVKPTQTNGLKVVPLLLLHGWPGSVREFYECIPMLTTPNPARNFIFEIIAPSLPGFGFSEGAARPGLSALQVAVIAKNLMERLGFDKWYVQGGDWGSEVATHMSILYPRKIIGLHLNMAILQMPKMVLKWMLCSFWPSLVIDAKNKSKIYPVSKFFKLLLRETGYLHIQATRPDTVGVALNESPLGTAAYILEKFIVGTHEDLLLQDDGGLASKFGYEKLLDNIMIYWFSKSHTTAMRLYAESFGNSKPYRDISKIPVGVPTAYAQFGEDALYMPKGLLKGKFENLARYSEPPRGGHFAALQEPQLFADDVWDAVETFENYRKSH